MPTRHRPILAALSLALFLAGSCGGGGFTSAACPEGSEGCACYGNESCDAGLDCSDGFCRRPGAGAGGSSNPSECSPACGIGESCISGDCVCQPGRERCDACVDTASDPDHCGACSRACADDEVCSNSACDADCGSGLEQCGRMCVNVATSAEHCGMCDNACTGGRECNDGSCACPDGQELCNSSCVPGGSSCSGGSAGAANSSGSGGDSGASSGDAGMAGVNGGTGGAATGGTGAGGGGTGGDAGSSDGPPTVMILLDRSSSMFQPKDEIWDIAYSALMEQDGAVLAFEDEVRFGFASFRGPDDTSVPETNAACAEITVVSPFLGNHVAIDAHYVELGELGTGGLAWETPTGHAINRVTMGLTSDTSRGRRYILLVTDGNPNTCRVGDPQCGQDIAIKAVQDAHAAGVSTLVLGFGDLLQTNSGCNPPTMRCGEDHLQDMANAGVGAGVMAPPDAYVFEECAVQEGGVLLATYGTPGNAAYYGGTTREQLRTALVSMLQRIVDGNVP